MLQIQNVNVFNCTWKKNLVTPFAWCWSAVKISYESLKWALKCLKHYSQCKTLQSSSCSDSCSSNVDSYVTYCFISNLIIYKDANFQGKMPTHRESQNEVLQIWTESVYYIMKIKLICITPSNQSNKVLHNSRIKLDLIKSHHRNIIKGALE